MDNKIIQKYIDDNQEVELLDKLNSYVITQVDKRFFNVIKILIYGQENAVRDWTQFNRALVELISQMLGKIFSAEGEGHLDELISTIEQNAPSPYQNISYLGRQFIIGIGDNDSKFSNKGLSEHNLQKLKEGFQAMNIRLLKKAIEENLPDQDIINLLYHSVDHLGKERKTFLLKEALQKFHAYVKEKPINYLKGFIRPYYTGTSKMYIDHYYHVPEPFHSQIFPEGFESFLSEIVTSDIDESLLKDVTLFFAAFNQEPKVDLDRRVILFSNEMERNGLQRPPKMITLKSDQHQGVRKECRPPTYRSQDEKLSEENYGYH